MDGKNAYLDLTIISAADLKRSWLPGDKMTAVAWVDPSEKRTTSSVNRHGSNAQWSHEKLNLRLNGLDGCMSPGKLLTIEIHARGTWGDSLLGSVYVPLIELTSGAERSGKTILMYEIVKPSGKRQGSIRFLAKIVQPRVSTPPPSVMPPVLFTEDDAIINRSRSNVSLYPPQNAASDIQINDERPASEANLPYSDHHPLQPRFSLAGHESWQHTVSPDPSYGMGLYNSHVHPPANRIHPLHTSASCMSPHSNHTGNLPYPPPSLLAMEGHYPPPTSVYPPHTAYLEVPYPPLAPRPQFPETKPPYTLEAFSSTPFPLCANSLSPFYPPFSSPQPDTFHNQ